MTVEERRARAALYAARHRARRLAGTVKQIRPGSGRKKADRVYTPMDAIVARPSVRIMRVMRWLDWATARDVMTAMDLPPEIGEAEYDRLLTSLGDLTRSGRVEIDRTARPYLYRLTGSGRAELMRVLSPPLEDAHP